MSFMGISLYGSLVRGVISSLTVSEPKVFKLSHLLQDKQASGVEITIVSWEPDSYGFGDVAFW